MITFRCSSCQQKLSLPPEHAGRRVKCPKCAMVQSVPVSSQASVEIASPVAAAPSPVPVVPPPANIPLAKPVSPVLAVPAAPMAVPVPPPPAPPPEDATAVTLLPPESPNLMVRPTVQNSSEVMETIASVGSISQIAANIKRSNEEPTLVECLAPPQSDDELGRLGKYRVLSIIGRGGMGVVYKAEDPFTKRFVALKAILPSLGASEDIRVRFMREAVSMAKVEHENVVRLYEVNEDRKIPFMAMEFLVGLPLDRYLEKVGRVDIREAARIGREIAEGLAVAHGHGLMHRDIKPANLWIEEANSRVKILDFGLARAMQEDARLTATGAVLGTPAYMSPEQSQGEIVDWRADLFSLGVVLYLLATGKLPFYAKDALSTMIAIATETPALPRTHNPEIPDGLSDLIMKLLAKDPKQRGESAREIAAVLRKIERGEAIEAPVAQMPSPAPEVSVTERPTGAHSDSKLVVIIAVAVGLGCLLIGGAVAAYFAFR